MNYEGSGSSVEMPTGLSFDPCLAGSTMAVLGPPSDSAGDAWGRASVSSKASLSNQQPYAGRYSQDLAQNRDRIAIRSQRVLAWALIWNDRVL